jgi:hypothetical protein
LRKTNVCALCGIFILFFHHAEGPERVLDTSSFSPPQIGSYLVLSCEWQIYFFSSSVLFLKGHTAKALYRKLAKNIPRNETARPPSQSDLYTVFPRSATKRNTVLQNGQIVGIYKSLKDTKM